MFLNLHVPNDGRTILERIPQWLETHDDLEYFYICIHEACHVVHKRDLGFNPSMYGPHLAYFPVLGWCHVDGAVESLPGFISMNADLVLVGKCYLGPAYLEVMLRGEDQTPGIWKAALKKYKFKVDLSHYNNWCVRRHQKGDNIEGLSSKIWDAVIADYQSIAFHQKIWATACEYDQRTSEAKKVA
jgi:hypothetical protein